MMKKRFKNCSVSEKYVNIALIRSVKNKWPQKILTKIKIIYLLIKHGMVLELEPCGILFTEIRFMNHRVERRANLQRNRKIFRQKGNFSGFLGSSVNSFPSIFRGLVFSTLQLPGSLSLLEKYNFCIYLLCIKYKYKIVKVTAER